MKWNNFHDNESYYLTIIFPVEFCYFVHNGICFILKKEKRRRSGTIYWSFCLVNLFFVGMFMLYNRFDLMRHDALLLLFSPWRIWLPLKHCNNDWSSCAVNAIHEGHCPQHLVFIQYLATGDPYSWPKQSISLTWGCSLSWFDPCLLVLLLLFLLIKICCDGAIWWSSTGSLTCHLVGLGPKLM